MQVHLVKQHWIASKWKNIKFKQNNLTSGAHDALNSLQLTLSNRPLLICFLFQICCTTETSTQVDRLHNELIKHMLFCWNSPRSSVIEKWNSVSHDIDTGLLMNFSHGQYNAVSDSPWFHLGKFNYSG